MSISIRDVQGESDQNPSIVKKLNPKIVQKTRGPGSGCCPKFSMTEEFSV